MRKGLTYIDDRSDSAFYCDVNYRDADDGISPNFNTNEWSDIDIDVYDFEADEIDESALATDNIETDYWWNGDQDVWDTLEEFT